MFRASKGRDKLSIINDQLGFSTYTKDLATLLVDMIESDKYGVYHAANEGFCLWHDFSKEIFDVVGVNIDTTPINTSQYPTKASIPMNSKMSKKKLIDKEFNQLRSWEDAVGEYVRNA